MNNRTVLWDPNADKRNTTLRQPKGLTITQQSAPSSSPNTTPRDETPRLSSKSLVDRETLVANSTLNASATEWYPKNIYTPSPVEVITSSVQKRLQIHRECPQVNNINNEGTEEYSPDLNRIKQIITTLTKDPGQFHDLIDLFMETLVPYLEDIMITSLVAEIIVEQAINSPNFRYTAARLCWTIEPVSPQFRAELHLKCKKQIDDNPDPKNVLPLIAELYIQLPHLHVYGTLLFKLFKKLLDIGGNENIKTICQALKLTGYSLEQSNKSELDMIFSHLRSVRNRVDGSAAFLLDSLYPLRASNWGHFTEESESESDDAGFDGIQSQVTYDIDGETLTTEEREFLASHINAEDEYDIEDDSDPDELCDPEPEMDEEIQEAFKEFVKFSGQK
ncbi:polyadenylate-binding protein-interacting protein 1 [Diabrotica virgifera virgifera]|uniref:Polyadenylate-binding protein-interacting protein 1 n=1 Tax=Diabrotica virgifera virgifera TaxID=50390 RepID=A0A6P7GLA9_DIAVI|nr:polyadenylate-binding protein-interacting protein 1 [Diabrotica virgifera virgifera]